MDAIVCDVRLHRCVLSEGRCYKYFFFNSVIIFLHLILLRIVALYKRGWVGWGCLYFVGKNVFWVVLACESLHVFTEDLAP